MLLKLTAQEEPTNIYVQTENIVAFVNVMAVLKLQQTILNYLSM